MDGSAATAQDLSSRAICVVLFKDGFGVVFSTVPHFERLRQAPAYDILRQAGSGGRFEIDGCAYRFTHAEFKIEEVQEYAQCTVDGFPAVLLAGLEFLQIRQNGAEREFKIANLHFSCFESDIVISCQAPPECFEITFRKEAEAWEVFELLRFSRFYAHTPASKCQISSEEMQSNGAVFPALKIQTETCETEQQSAYPSVTQVHATELTDNAVETENAHMNSFEEETTNLPVISSEIGVIEKENNNNKVISPESTIMDAEYRFRSDFERASYAAYESVYKLHYNGSTALTERDLELAHDFVRSSPHRVASLELETRRLTKALEDENPKPLIAADELKLSSGEQWEQRPRDLAEELNAAVMTSSAAIASLERSTVFPQYRTDKQCCDEIRAEVSEAVDHLEGGCAIPKIISQLPPIRDPPDLLRSSGCEMPVQHGIPGVTANISAISCVEQMSSDSGTNTCIPKRNVVAARARRRRKG